MSNTSDITFRVQPSETNGDMLNLEDDEPQPLANGHASGQVESALAPSTPDPMAELMGLNLGGPSPASAPQQAQPVPGASYLLVILYPLILNQHG